MARHIETCQKCLLKRQTGISLHSVCFCHLRLCTLHNRQQIAAIFVFRSIQCVVSDKLRGWFNVITQFHVSSWNYGHPTGTPEPLLDEVSTALMYLVLLQAWSGQTFVVKTTVNKIFMKTSVYWVMSHGSWVKGHGLWVTGWVTSHGSLVMGHWSRVIVHGSWVTGYGSRVMSHGSRFMDHGSRVMSHGSWVTGHGSWVTGYGSRFMSHGSWVTGHGSPQLQLEAWYKLPVYNKKSGDEECDVYADDIHEPQTVAADTGRHVAIEPPQLRHWTLHCM